MLRKNEIKSENQVYKRYITVLDRTVLHSNGKEFKWDGGWRDLTTVAGHSRKMSPAFVNVMPFHSADSSVTLVYEYCQGPNDFFYTVPAGMYDDKKHNTDMDAAKAELAEEARLKKGEWSLLVEPDSQGIPDLKWSINRYFAYLCIDPEEMTAEEIEAMPRDAEEEGMMQVERMPLSKALDLCHQGKVLPPACTTILLALNRLGRIKVL